MSLPASIRWASSLLNVSATPTFSGLLLYTLEQIVVLLLAGAKDDQLHVHGEQLVHHIIDQIETFLVRQPEMIPMTGVFYRREARTSPGALSCSPA